jgi:hypothetical protein
MSCPHGALSAEWCSPCLHAERDALRAELAEVKARLEEAIALTKEAIAFIETSPLSVDGDDEKIMLARLRGVKL